MGISFWLYGVACLMCGLTHLSPIESARTRAVVGWMWCALGAFSLAVSFFK